tara:strand:+ start:25 stop:510 length:486 start_codon:yes stop_codon:yes gene_type:complete
MTYTIYYGTLPNGRDKIGVDEAWPNRVKEQSLTNYYILETHSDEMVASRREPLLQKEHGLKVDQFPYHLRKVRGTLGGIKRGNMSDMKGDQQREAWANYTEEEKAQRSLNISINQGSRRLTLEQEAEIQQKYIPRVYTLHMLGEEYGCTYGNIHRIVHKKR